VKKIIKCFVLMLGLAMLVVSKPSIAFAQTAEQDNLKVKFKVEQVQDSSKEVRGTVKITNVGVRPIKDINIESILPEGIKLKEGSALTKKVETLEAWESISFEFFGELSNNSTPGNNGGSDNQTPGNDGENNNSTPSNNGGSNNPSTNDSGSTSKDVSGSVSTGDNNIILALTVLILICSGGIILLSKKKKKIKKALSIFLCVTLVSALIGNSTIARAIEGENKKISVKENIIINEKSYTFETVVSYKIQSDVVVPSGEVISRGQWISMLMDTIALQSEQQI